jgi:hypothetical protein
MKRLLTIVVLLCFVFVSFVPMALVIVHADGCTRELCSLCPFMLCKYKMLEQLSRATIIVGFLFGIAVLTTFILGVQSRVSRKYPVNLVDVCIRMDN